MLILSPNINNKLLYNLLFIFLSGVFFNSCSDSVDDSKAVNSLIIDRKPVAIIPEIIETATVEVEEDSPIEYSTEPIPTIGVAIGAITGVPVISSARPTVIPAIEIYANKYKVKLAADKVIEIPEHGELIVWIGLPQYEKKLPEEMTQESGSLPMIGKSAKIVPFSAGIEIEPKKSECLIIHPTGSTARFKLIAKETGTFNVSADVNLFDSDNCNGTPIPKAAVTLKVIVQVDEYKRFIDIFWEKLFDFWGALITTLLGLILFILRKKLKKLFGYDSDE